MTRYWLASAAAFAMMTGVALAQGMSSQSTTSSTTSTTVPVVGSYSATETQRTIDSNGNQIDKSRSYQTGSGGSSSSSSSQATSPDGALQIDRHEENSVSPDGATTVTRKTTTTTDR
jgi:hypothetical protein